MVVDVALNPRVAKLLGRIEEVRRLVQEHPEGHEARAGLEARMEAFYAELGRYVHWLVRQDPPALARVAEEGRRWADALGENLRVELLPEVSVERIEDLDVPDDESHDIAVSELIGVEFTGDSRADAVDVRRLGHDGAFEADFVSEAVPLELGEDMEPLDDEDIGSDDSSFTDLEEVSVEDDGTSKDEGPIGVRAVSVEAPPLRPPSRAPEPPRAPVAPGDAERDWLGSLRELLDLLGPPEAVDPDPARRGAAVGSLVSATSHVEARWSVFPHTVQQALLGLVGARARRLDPELSSDPDVRLAMGRLRRFAEPRGLTLVPALLEGPPATPRNWAIDERRYWTVLRAGM